MNFRIPYQIGSRDGEAGFLHIDGHTNGVGHSLITGTVGIKAVETRLREVLDEIARDIEQGVKRGATIE